MGWGWRGRSGGWAGPWPGRGPFSYLPPWQRPCWFFRFRRGFERGYGRGWWVYPWSPPVPAMSPEDELAALEDYKKYLEAERADLEQETKEVEARIKELKAAI